MAGNTRWTSYNDVKEHPEDSILLAYLRKQQVKDRLSVSQHINLEQCPRCLHKLDELEQVSATLDVLGKIRSYQHYQELSVADTYERMQKAASHRTPTKASLNGANQRQRPRKSVVRLISLPAAFGLAILFTVAMLVFANLSGTSRNPEPSKESISNSQGNSTVVVVPHSTPTPDLNLTATAGTTPELTATKAYIKVCSTPADIVQWRLVICGHNFDPAHKAALLAFGKKPMWQSNLPVDQHGTFQFGWNI
ncbi:MAG TPA: hypothetical protein VFZ02_09010, partial [Ktedonobacteraceae bacterium]